MDDKPKDFLGLGTRAKDGSDREPALMVGAPYGPREMMVAHAMHQRGAFGTTTETEFKFTDPSSGRITSTKQFENSRVLITVVDDDSGEERWSEHPVDAGGNRLMLVNEGDVWRRVMKWPRVPTVAEATAWMANKTAEHVANYWDEMQAAIAADAADGFVYSMGPGRTNGQ